jgi:pectate lyase
MRAILYVIAFLPVLLPAGTTFAASSPVAKHLHHPDSWYKGEQATHIAQAVLSFQSPQGDWPKNIDTATTPYTGKPQDLHGTFDNGATTPELRYLARMITSSSEARYANAFLKGLDQILAAQYDNGGWPQFYPSPAGKYYRHITFNDDAMVRLMDFLRDVATQDKTYAFVDAQRRQKCQTAWDKGVECILNCQIVVAGQPTVWCAQHDQTTLAPTNARSFELASFSGDESAGIVTLLMQLQNPSDRVKRAVKGAAIWYQQHKLTGLRTQRRPDKNAPKGFDVIVVNDPHAPPLWARFYDLQTGQPFFCGRDGIKKPTLAQIELERRAGYVWLGTWGQKVLDAYPKWAARHGLPIDTASK